MRRRTKPSRRTRAEERKDAAVSSRPDREPTADEAAAADRHPLNPDAARRAAAMYRRGADEQGEGRLP
jgi:hypothetical protein